jgi:hypothetical protein
LLLIWRSWSSWRAGAAKVTIAALSAVNVTFAADLVISVVVGVLVQRK